MRRGTLLVLLKAPVPGRVKTRLAASIGDARAAAAYVEMAREVRDEVGRLHDIDVRWVYSGAAAFPDLSWLGLANTKFWRQTGADLGARLTTAFKRAFARASEPVCAIGVDSPGLAASRMRDAFSAMPAHDAVVGPTEDGGYYLIGMSRYEPRLFADIPWSGPEVLKRTLSAARAARLKAKLLPEYYDVDALAEYERWRDSCRKNLL